MGESGMLELFLSLLSTQHIPPNLVRPSLRLIGNACADTGTWPSSTPFVIDCLR
jgi:hypothetical protein